MASSAPTLASVPGLADAESILDAKELALATALVSLDQAHLFKNWRAGEREAEKHSFFEQVCIR